MTHKRNGRMAKVRRRGDAEKRAEAIGRLAEEGVAARQIERLDARLGVGIGAVKERARLAKLAA